MRPDEESQAENGWFHYKFQLWMLVLLTLQYLIAGTPVSMYPLGKSIS